MPTEIERKFLVRNGDWQNARTEGTLIRQGYLPTASGVTARIRRSGRQAFITLKGPASEGGLVRPEYEYEIPLDHAEEMLSCFCQHPVIEKTRHGVRHGKCLWYIDVFSGQNSGLVLAEVEMDKVDVDVPLPSWIGEEVTGDSRYRNSTLAKHPRQN